MRILIQRVKSGRVTTAGNTVGEIGRGLLVLVGFSTEDSTASFETVAKKLLNLRLWSSFSELEGEEREKAEKRWDTSVVQNGYEILIVSQFTLYSTMNGNKPDFRKAKPGPEARELFDRLVELLRKGYATEKVQTGSFGEYMQVENVIDGPVTLQWEF